MPGLESFDNLNGFRTQVFDAAVWRTLVQSHMRIFRDRHLMPLQHVLESCARPQCSDLMKLDTSIGGEIVVVSEVLNKKQVFWWDTGDQIKSISDRRLTPLD
jgi:hypothetical protein